jgi:hypothetical protein
MATRKLDLDLLKLELEASNYLSKVTSGNSDSNSRPSTDGISPILEAVNNGQATSLFAMALDTKCLSVASLCVSPLPVGLASSKPAPDDLIKSYDGNTPGKALRAVCVALSNRDYPIEAVDALSKSLALNGLAPLNTLVKNGLYEMGRAVAVSRFREDEVSVDRLLISNFHEHSGVDVAGSFSDVLQETQYAMFKAYIEEGSMVYIKEFFEFANGLCMGNDSLQTTMVNSYLRAFQKAFQRPASHDEAQVVSLLLTVDQPALDGYRLAVIKEVDPNLGLDDYLKASFLVASLSKNSEYELETIVAEAYLVAGIDVITQGIRDREDYLSLSRIPRFDMDKIDVKKIPKQARGAALEHGLGL